MTVELTAFVAVAVVQVMSTPLVFPTADPFERISHIANEKNSTNQQTGLGSHPAFTSYTIMIVFVSIWRSMLCPITFYRCKNLDCCGHRRSGGWHICGWCDSRSAGNSLLLVDPRPLKSKNKYSFSIELQAVNNHRPHTNIQKK